VPTLISEQATIEGTAFCILKLSLVAPEGILPEERA
jgi:hypothetical protein